MSLANVRLLKYQVDLKITAVKKIILIQKEKKTWKEHIYKLSLEESNKEEPNLENINIEENQEDKKQKEKEY